MAFWRAISRAACSDVKLLTFIGVAAAAVATGAGELFGLPNA